MRMFDSLNPSYIASASGAIVSIATGDVCTPTPFAAVVGSTNILATLVTRYAMDVINPVWPTLALSGVVVGSTCSINGVTYTCVANGAGAGQFNLGGSDAATAANLVTAFNAAQTYGTSGVFLCGKAAKLILQSVVTGTGAVAASVTLQVSVDGATFFTHPGLSTVTLSGTTQAQSITPPLDAYPFIQAQVSGLAVGNRAVVSFTDYLL